MVGQVAGWLGEWAAVLVPGLPYRCQDVCREPDSPGS